MKNESFNRATSIKKAFPRRTILENERKKLKEETLHWISQSALSKLRVAWSN